MWRRITSIADQTTRTGAVRDLADVIEAATELILVLTARSVRRGASSQHREHGGDQHRKRLQGVTANAQNEREPAHAATMRDPTNLYRAEARPRMMPKNGRGCQISHDEMIPAALFLELL